MAKIYDLEMTVPLGIRHGTMVLKENADGNVDGTIEILGNETPFTGKLDGIHLSMEGTLKTQIRNVSYQGQGTLEGERIEMKIKDNQNIYRLSGKDRKER